MTYKSPYKLPKRRWVNMQECQLSCFEKSRDRWVNIQEYRLSKAGKPGLNGWVNMQE